MEIECEHNTSNVLKLYMLTLKMLGTTIDALGQFETAQWEGIGDVSCEWLLILICANERVI